MNKGDLINEMAKVVSTKKEAQEVVDCVFSSITKAMKTGDTVTLVGFGTFKVVDRKARKGRNPQTGAEIDIKASKAPKFTPGKALKEAVKKRFIQRPNNFYKLIHFNGGVLFKGLCRFFL